MQKLLIRFRSITNFFLNIKIDGRVKDLDKGKSEISNILNKRIEESLLTKLEYDCIYKKKLILNRK